MNTIRPIIGTKPVIGISQCLTNSIVRYDGKSQYNKSLIDELSQCFELLSICPEVECGLGMPRPPVELIGTTKGIRIIGRDDKTLDVSNSLKKFSANKVLSLSHLSGCVFKTRSPSCGVESTPVYSSSGDVKYYSNGVFVDALVTLYPALPIIEDVALNNKAKLTDFILCVNNYFVDK